MSADNVGYAKKITDLGAAAGIGRIHMLAWRDLADTEAGGSEIHASKLAKCWADAGIEVTMRSSYAAGSPPEAERDGYRVIRRAGRYMIFPRAAVAELTGRHGRRDALVEIWNGVPFFSPLWARGPRVTWIHHVHEDMWPLVLPPRLARAGQILECRVAPLFYRRTPIVALSHSSRRNIVERLRLPERNVHVVEPGIAAEYTPGGVRAAEPTVLAVGRLMPSKSFEVLIRAVAELQATVPGTRLVICGEGYERPKLERWVRDLGVEAQVELLGRVTDAELLARYRSAWVVASASRWEGWGMTLTEAAACGTPAVASRIAGHVDSVADGITGVLVDSDDDYAAVLAGLLADPARRDRLGAAASARAVGFTWERAAHDALAVLASPSSARSSPSTPS